MLLVPEKKVLVFVSDFCLGEALLRENGCLGGGWKTEWSYYRLCPHPTLNREQLWTQKNTHTKTNIRTDPNTHTTDCNFSGVQKNQGAQGWNCGNLGDVKNVPQGHWGMRPFADNLRCYWFFIIFPFFRKKSNDVYISPPGVSGISEILRPLHYRVQQGAHLKDMMMMVLVVVVMMVVIVMVLMVMVMVMVLVVGYFLNIFTCSQ